MRIIKIKIDPLEKEQVKIGKTRIIARGVTNIPQKSKGGVGRFQKNTGLTKNVRSGRMKKSTVDKNLPSWKNYVNGKVSFAVMQALQASGK